MVSMMWSGHNRSARELVATRILAKFDSNMRNYNELNRPLYRSKAERRLQEKPDKSDWFRTDGTTTTVVVPTTAGSQLANRVRECIKNNLRPKGTKVRVVEKPGEPILGTIGKNDPFPPDWCGRNKCPVKISGKECLKSCLKESITYRAICQRCDQVQKEAGVTPLIEYAYEGETSRKLFTRYQQHLVDYKKAARNPRIYSNNTNNSSLEDPSSWMWDHTVQHHNGQVGTNPEKDYIFSVVGSHKDPMDRQITEALRIEQSFKGFKPAIKNKIPQKVVSLNRRGEHFSPIARLYTQ